MKRITALLILIALLCPVLTAATLAATDAPAQPAQLNDSLVTLLDFTGDTDKEQKKDKAPAGKAYDSIAVIGTASIADGIATVPADVGAYLSIKATDSSDIYDLKNKTLIFRAKMTPVQTPGAVTAFVDAPALSITQANATTNYQMTVTPRIDNTNKAHMVTGAFASTEDCTYAISMAEDTDAKTITFSFYQSKKTAEFTLLDTWSETYTDASATLQKTGNWIFGKRSNKLDKVSSSAFEFDDIRVYSKPLTAADLTAVATGEADRAYAAAQADVQLVAYQTAGRADSYDIRFIGTVGSTEHSAVGFEILAVYDNGSRRFCRESSTVYTSLLGVSENGITEKVTVEDMGGTYLVALTVTGIPRSVGSVSFRVRPYTVDTNGNKAYGTEKTVTNPIQ